MSMKGRSFLKLLDYTPAEIDELLTLAARLKSMKKAGTPHRLCEGKNVALIFEKTSTRTRSSFEVAAHDLGMGSTYLDSTGSQIGKKESIADTARVLSGMFDGIEYRGFGQEIVEELAPEPEESLRFLLERKYQRSLSDEKGRRRVFAALQRLGYSGEDIRTALRDYIDYENED